MNPRYRKQTLFAGIGEEGQSRLQASRVTIVGCGALGSVTAETLARAGVGVLRLVDRDFVELSNLQRQVLYSEADVAARLPKAVAAAAHLREINSEIVVESHVCDLAHGNVRELVRDADLILDGTDNFETRFLINDAALEFRIPWVHGGCVAAQGQVMAIVPGQTPCLRCLMPEVPGPGAGETCDTAGVIGPAVQIVAALQCVQALKILTGQASLIRPILHVLDVWEGTWRHLNLERLLADGNCAACRGGERLWLEGRRNTQSTVLCGRNSVQISPATGSKLSLPQIEERLQSAGTVRRNPFLLFFQPADSTCELTVFSDGRAIISGTEDLNEARSLYARYVGQ